MIRHRIVVLFLFVLALGAPRSAAAETFARPLPERDPAAVEARLLALDEVDAEPIKCGTWLIHEARQIRSSLSVAGQAALDRRLALKEADQSFESAGGHFVIEYGIAGLDSVPVTDADESGVPDYVEWVAEAMEESWQAEIEDLGFSEVPLGVGERYRVRLVNSSIYGETRQSTDPGGSFILINQDFARFYAARPGLIGEDPDGKVRGAIRVTAAHELKHAIQLVRSGWSEFTFDPGWLELDATFMEDVVYDQVNDYYNYLINGGSPFTSPTTTLIQASYEDSTWQHFLLERHGWPVVLRYWQRRGQVYSGESPQESYVAALQLEGLDWVDNWNEYQSWNWASGSRSRSGFGFGEAERFPVAVTQAFDAPLPYVSGTQSLAGMASRYHQLENTGRFLDGELTLRFDGAPAAPWAASLVLQRAEDLEVFPVMLEAEAGSVRTVGFDFSDYDRAAVLVGNASTSTARQEYSFGLSLGEGDTTVVSPTVTRLRRLGPNPAPAGTDVRYELSAERSGLLRAQIYDIRGRRVRELLRESATAGQPVLFDFDGRGDGGELLAAGVYYLRVDLAGLERTSRLVLLD